MNIKSITLTNFRNHKKLHMDFDPKINLIVGPNGAGKTNILEAIHLISTTKSFRARFDRDLIKHNEDFAKVEAKITSKDETEDYELQIVKSPRTENTSIKKVKVNSIPKSLSNFTSLVSTVLFSPEDIDIITGSPSNRRKYLNMLLFQVDKGYKKTCADYVKVVRRRNKLLENIRDTSRGYDQLPFWNNKLLELGENIQQRREELIIHLNNYMLKDEVEHIRNSKVLSVKYKINRVDTKRLLEYKDLEIRAKKTLIGPHRDDLIFAQNDNDMAQFASRGEQRTSIFLLKQAEYAYITLKLGTKPILLLDDIFSELDNNHRETILSYISNQQTIITTAVKKEFSDFYVNNTVSLT
ncbi:DNA replication/repair protein RecF [Patescibacteria group bacterium]